MPDTRRLQRHIRQKQQPQHSSSMQQQQRAANLQKKIQAGKLSLEPCIFFLKKTELDDGTAAFSDISLGKDNNFLEQPLDQGIRVCMGYFAFSKHCASKTS